MKLKLAVVQESPVFFDKKKSIEKLSEIVSGLSRQGCKLILFPESFIPGYPRGFTFGAKIGSRSTEGRKLYSEYHKQSVDLQSDDLNHLEEIAKSNKSYLVIGITEKESNSGSLYCSMIYISPEKGLLGVHRKIKPTGTERLIWAEGDGSTLVSFDTEIGKLGGLICWENYMPLARMSMYKKGVEIYLAPTADSRENWATSMKHIALEGRCFVLGCNQYFTKTMYPENYHNLVENEPEEICPGGSLIVSPSGKIIAGPLYGAAGSLIAEIDLDEITEQKLDFDSNGHYSRNDIFDFKVIGQPEMKKE